MFYYLLYNSSFLKKKKNKDKIVFTLIGGSLVYLVLHAFISNTCKTDILKYIWFLLLIDISAVFISSDFEGFSSVQFTQVNPTTITQPNFPEKNNNSPYNQNSQPESYPEDEIIPEKLSLTKNKKTKKKKPNSEKQKSIKSILKTKEKPGKKVTFEDSTDIQTIRTETETYNAEEADNINLTLESLENLQLDIEQPTDITQFNMPRKKMEDEYSDIGSELDLAKFEDSIVAGE